MGKLKTPDWVLEGYKSLAEYDESLAKTSRAPQSPNNFNQGLQGEKAKGIKKKKNKEEKKFKIKVCPECSSDDVGVVLTGEEGRRAREWECRKCRWTGKDIVEKELSEEEFMEYLDKKGEEVA